MIANRYGHMEGKRHESGMLAVSGLPPQLQLHSHTPNGNSLFVYGDPEHPLRFILQGFFEVNLNQ